MLAFQACDDEAADTLGEAGGLHERGDGAAHGGRVVGVDQFVGAADEADFLALLDAGDDADAGGVERLTLVGLGIQHGPGAEERAERGDVLLPEARGDLVAGDHAEGVQRFLVERSEAVDDGLGHGGGVGNVLHGGGEVLDGADEVLDCAVVDDENAGRAHALSLALLAGEGVVVGLDAVHADEAGVVHHAVDGRDGLGAGPDGDERACHGEEGRDDQADAEGGLGNAFGEARERGEAAGLRLEGAAALIEAAAEQPRGPGRQSGTFTAHGFGADSPASSIDVFAASVSALSGGLPWP